MRAARALQADGAAGEEVRTARLRRVGKGAGTASPDDTISRAPCPRVTERDASRKTAWARRTMDLTVGSGRARAFAHPTIPAQLPWADSRHCRRTPPRGRARAPASPAGR